MKERKYKISKLKPDVKGAIAPTIVVTLIFFITYFGFGAENSMIGPFATLAFLRLRSMHNHYECLIKNFLIYMVMAVLAFFAVMNLPLCMLVNAAGLFWIGYLLIDEYNPTNYFPAGMALIFFQIAPIYTWDALATRLAALLASAVIVLVFVVILAQFDKNREPLISYIQEGFSICKKQLELWKKEGEVEEAELEHLHHALCDVNKKCSGQIYATNRAMLRKKCRANWYCHFIAVFQVMNYLTDKAEMEESKENLEKANSLYEKFSHEFETVTPEPEYDKLNFRIRKPDMRSFRLRFALRQLLVVPPCLVFAWASQLQNAYWLVISVFFMMVPLTDHTVQRIRQRVAGTVAGVLICFGLFYLFPSFWARVLIMTIANFMIYGADGYGPTVAYITCSALAVQTLDATVSIVLLERLVYTFIGALIALLANRWIFPIRARKQILYLEELIRNLREELTAYPPDAIGEHPSFVKEINQRIVKNYMLMQRLEDMYRMHAVEAKEEDFRKFQKQHMTFLAEYMSKYMV